MSWVDRPYPWVVLNADITQVGSTGFQPPYPSWGWYYNVTGTISSAIDTANPSLFSGWIIGADIEVSVSVGPSSTQGHVFRNAISNQNLDFNVGGVRTFINCVPYLSDIRLTGSITGNNSARLAPFRWISAGDHRNIISFVEIVGGGSTAAGIVGNMSGGSTLTDCRFEGEIKNCSGIGGIVGDASNCAISRCSVSAELEALGAGAGGIVQLLGSNATLTNSYFRGSITDASLGVVSRYGGIAAEVQGSATDCYAIGSIHHAGGSNNVGSLFGRSEGSGTVAQRCWSAMDIQGPSYTYVNAALGRAINGTPTFVDCLFDADVNNRPNIHPGVEPKTTAEMQNIQTYLDSNFDIESKVWP